MEWIETTGVSVDEAKEKALDRLGVAEDDLEYQVLAEPTRALSGSDGRTPGCEPVLGR